MIVNDFPESNLHPIKIKHYQSLPLHPSPRPPHPNRSWESFSCSVPSTNAALPWAVRAAIP